MRAKLVVGMAVGVFLVACGTGGSKTEGTDGTSSSYVGAQGSNLLAGDGCVHTSAWSEDSAACGGSSGEGDAKSDSQSVAQTSAQTRTTTPATVAVASPAQLPERVVLVGRTMFQFDSDLLSTEGSNEMRKLSAMLRGYKDVRKVEVVGHTDSNGSKAYNQALSERRAETVKNWFQSVIPGFPVIATGAGESTPLASNDTREGRSLNRRVEIKVDAIR